MNQGEPTLFDAPDWPPDAEEPDGEAVRDVLLRPSRPGAMRFKPKGAIPTAPLVVCFHGTPDCRNRSNALSEAPDTRLHRSVGYWANRLGTQVMMSVCVLPRGWGRGIKRLWTIYPGEDIEWVTQELPERITVMLDGGVVTSADRMDLQRDGRPVYRVRPPLRRKG